MDRVLDCQFYRRFGVEVEINTLDGRIYKNEMPFGADHIAEIVNQNANSRVQIQKWDHNYNNDCWIIKPDSSCGLEVCTPVFKGWFGLKELVKVVEAFKHSGVKADRRCSLHVHVNIGDLNMMQLASVVAWYIKCEHIFLDSVPSYRKQSRYCQMLGMSDLFEEDYLIHPVSLLERISTVKYFTLNAYHFMKGGGFLPKNSRKKTIEYRIGENDMCLNGYDVKNWVRFLIHFVEMTKDIGLPKEYVVGDSSTGLLWMDIEPMFKLLGFDQAISPGLNQVKQWFLYRIQKHGYNSHLDGMWSNKGREYARTDFITYLANHNLDVFDGQYTEDMLYGEKYAI